MMFAAANAFHNHCQHKKSAGVAYGNKLNPKRCRPGPDRGRGRNTFQRTSKHISSFSASKVRFCLFRMVTGSFPRRRAQRNVSGCCEGFPFWQADNLKLPAVCRCRPSASKLLYTAKKIVTSRCTSVSSQIWCKITSDKKNRI